MKSATAQFPFSKICFNLFQLEQALTKFHFSLLLTICQSRCTDKPFKMYFGIPLRIQVLLVIKAVSSYAYPFSFSSQMIECLGVLCWQVGKPNESSS